MVEGVIDRPKGSVRKEEKAVDNFGRVLSEFQKELDKLSEIKQLSEVEKKELLPENVVVDKVSGLRENMNFIGRFRKINDDEEIGERIKELGDVVFENKGKLTRGEVAEFIGFFFDIDANFVRGEEGYAARYREDERLKDWVKMYETMGLSKDVKSM